jgi:hypothetical protein
MLAAEHALELERLDLGPQRLDIPIDTGRRGGITLGFGEIEQIRAVGEPALQPPELRYQAIQLGALATERLGPGRVIPDARVFQRLLDLGQPFGLAVQVKDTPGAVAAGRRGRAAADG